MAITLDERKLNEIVERVVEKLAPAVGAKVVPATSPSATPARPGSACAPTPPTIVVPADGGGGGYQGGSYKAPKKGERGDYLAHDTVHRTPLPPVQTYSRSDEAEIHRRAPAVGHSRPGVFGDMDQAVAAAREAHVQIVHNYRVEDRVRFINAIRARARGLIPQMSKMAVEETGLGRYEDKLQKNACVVEKTPSVEMLRPDAYTGDDGLALMERAPFGVIGAITPTTNPTETVMNNAICMISGGNSVVFNTHPSAKGVCRWLIEELNHAVLDAGGPPNLLSCIAEPTIESAQKLMKHPGVRLVVVTGGPAVVAQAMQSGKRAVCAGPGNPPVVVDETADLERAARGVVAGASIDNNIVCIAEKELIVVRDVADALKRLLEKNGAAIMSDADIQKLERVVLTKDGHVNKEWVGKDAARIADAIGRRVPTETRLLLCEVDEKHPFVQEELLMPVFPMFRAEDADAAIEAAVRVEHGFGHTAVMYSTNIDNLHKMARAVNTSIFVKNGPCYNGIGMGGEGWTSWTIASPTGEGLTTPRTFTRERRCTIKDSFRIV
ncbi:MAG: aldehyde dehydrogenase family protein [Myxococcota bacterium]